MLEAERGNDGGDQLVVGKEAELGISEENLKALLEGKEKMALDDLYAHLGRQVREAVILRQEGVRRAAEVLTRVQLPDVDRTAIDALLGRQLPADLDDQALDLIDHVAGVLGRRDFLARHEVLNLLDRHRIEEHADELEEEYRAGLDRVSLRGVDIAEPTSRQRRGDKVQRNYVLLLLVRVVDALVSHPRLAKVAVSAQRDLHAREQVQIDQSCNDEKAKFHILAERAGLRPRRVLAIVLDDLTDVVVNLEQSADAQDLEKEVIHRVQVPDADKVRAKANDDLDEDLRGQVA